MIPFLSSLALFVFGTNGMDLPVLPMGALNPLGRLTAVGDLSDPDEDAAYGFDLTGNLTLSRVGSGGTPDAWAPADAGNRLGLRTSSPLEVVYDPAGRLINFDPTGVRRTVFTYSPQDELLTVTPIEGTPVTRRYDALGRVYEENTVRKVYDGAQVLFDGEVRRRWGSLDEPWGTVDSTLAVTHQSVNFLGHGQDDMGAFGELDGGASAAGFQGRPSVGDLNDFSSLRLWDHRARVYSPELKRFLTEDPHGLWGMNQYAFGGNDPVNFRDPSGLWAEDAVNFSSGIADILSFGVGPFARRFTGGQYVDMGTAAYTAGELVGIGIWGGVAFSQVSAVSSWAASTGPVVGWKGNEITFTSPGKASPDFRFAPLGNRTGKPEGELPHYHRRVIDPATGKTRPGGAIDRHRPWQPDNTPGLSWWQRFLSRF